MLNVIWALSNLILQASNEIKISVPIFLEKNYYPFTN